MSSTNTYAPSFVIKVDGTELRHGVTVDVLSVSVTDTANQADSFSITMRDRHPEPARFPAGARLEWIDSGLLDEGQEVEIRLGYVDHLDFKFRGDITAVSANFPESGVPTLSVRGFSRYHYLQRLRCKKTAFVSKSVSEIARDIARLANLQAQMDEIDVKRPFEDNNEKTMLAILKERADPYGFEVVVKWVEGRGHTLFFEEPKYLTAPGPVATFEWGKDLRSFSPSLSTYNMKTQVEARASQTSRGRGKDAIAFLANAGDVPGKLGPKSGPEIAKEFMDKTFGSAYVKDKVIYENRELYENHDIENQGEAKKIARAQLGLRAIEFISGRGSIIGNPALKARTVIELKGLGKRFSGKYYVTSVTHTIDASGYRTDFEVRRNAR